MNCVLNGAELSAYYRLKINALPGNNVCFRIWNCQVRVFNLAPLYMCPRFPGQLPARSGVRPHSESHACGI